MARGSSGSSATKAKGSSQKPVENTSILNILSTAKLNGKPQKPVLREKGYKTDDFGPLKIIWPLLIGYILLHLGAIYGIYLAVYVGQWKTLLWGYFMMWLSGFGISGGAHRLYSHRAYKAKWPLRLFAALCQTISFSSSLVSWSRYHRVHHKYCETNADPNDSRRGFFYAHAGWFLCEEQPECTKAKKEMNVDDCLRDPIAYYQHKFYPPLVILFSVVLPAWVPWYFWNETPLASLFIATILRQTLVTNASMLINSLAHSFNWGSHSYDKNFSPGENTLCNILTAGEGWHNYHHAFPWDYRSAELGRYGSNKVTRMIDFFAKIGWAYDLRTTSPEVIKKRVLRTGDGTHPYYSHEEYETTGENTEGHEY